MNNALHNLSRSNAVLPEERIKRSLPFSIAHISAPAFRLNLRQKDNLVFALSLYEFDQLIELKELEEAVPDIAELSLEETDEECVRRVLPTIYREYQDMFSKAASDLLPPHRSYDHKIELTTDNNLKFSPLYGHSSEELKILKQYLIDNLSKGFIEASQAPFAAPVLFVKKPGGGLRFCIDFRKLNAITRKDQYPLPLIDETLARLGKAKIFTKLDIRQAFHRIRIHPDSEELTTFRTRYGSYKCKVLPFGLTNGPSTYQHYMNDVLLDYLDDFCTVYLDDILIYSENRKEHAAHVKKVLQRLREAGLQVDIKKCEFSVESTRYLGFIVSTDGVSVDPAKVSAVRNWQAPTTVKGIQSFLGFCNFYRRFIRDYGRIAKPLNHLTRHDSVFDFGDECKASFEELKDRLCTAPILRYYDPKLESMLETDASDGVVAAILSQLYPDGEWYPVGYFSKTMAPAELNYPIHDKEMLAIVRALGQWRAELTGTSTAIKVLTDHRSLEYFMSSKILNSRQARWAEILADFFFVITYRPGKQNAKADALTRRDADVTTSDQVKEKERTQTLLPSDCLDWEVKKQLQISALDAPFGLVDQILRANRSRRQLESETDHLSRGQVGWEDKDGLLLYDGRLLVPDVDNLRTKLIAEAHNQVSTAHPGRNKTLALLARKYYWKSMRSWVEQFVANCQACRRALPTREKKHGFLHPLPIPDRPWQHVTHDFKSFPKDKHGYDMVYVVIDRLSKQSVCIPCNKNATAKDMARMYITYIYRWRGLPESMVSDRGPQFISQFWDEFCAILGIKIKLSTAYHPQTDGQTEIMNQYLDQRLRPFVNHYQDNWSDLLPMMDHAQLTLPHDSIGMSPFELNYGYQARTSFDWDTSKAPATASEKVNRQEAQQYATLLRDTWEVAKAHMEKAQAKQKRSSGLSPQG